MTMTYSILLLLLSYSSSVFAGSPCGDPFKCCTTDKPLECVYKTPTEQTADPKCNCAPKNKYTSREEQDRCGWSTKAAETTDYGKSIPCLGFYEFCPTAVAAERSSISCQFGYPPPSANSELNRKDKYCNIDTSKVDVYNVFFTCWLYTCRNRFEKPPETKSAEWCYPPTIVDGSLARKILEDDGNSTFCERYTVDNSVEYYDVNKKGTSFCVLPPLCKSGTNTTDTDKFMPTNYMKKGASNMDHCEQLCDRNGDNNGDFINEKPTCRVIPSCESENATTTTFNKFQVPTCLPWCTKNDSYVRSSSNTLRKENYGNNGKHCNPLPICNEGKAPEPRYGPLNPYAATGNNCIPSRVCGQGENSEKHFCWVGGPSEADTGGTPGSAGLSTWAIIVVSIVGVLLFIVLVLIAVIVFLRSRKPPKMEPLLSLTICYPGCSKEHVNEEAA